MAAAPVVIDVTDADFATTVVEESRRRPVVVDLWASWCGPCRTLGPILEKVAGERDGGFLLAKLDVDANPAVAGALGVQSIPTVVAFRDGRPVDGFVGALPEHDVNAFVDRILPTAAEVEADRAGAAVLAGDVVSAERGFRDAIAEDAANRAARVGLAGILVDRGDLDEAEQVLAPVLPDADAELLLARVRVARWADGSGGDAAADARALAVRGDHRGALEALLALAPTDDEARSSMVDLFAVLGDDPLVAEFRRRLTSALF